MVVNGIFIAGFFFLASSVLFLLELGKSGFTQLRHKSAQEIGFQNEGL